VTAPTTPTEFFAGFVWCRQRLGLQALRIEPRETDPPLTPGVPMFDTLADYCMIVKLADLRPEEGAVVEAILAKWPNGTQRQQAKWLKKKYPGLKWYHQRVGRIAGAVRRKLRVALNKREAQP